MKIILVIIVIIMNTINYSQTKNVKVNSIISVLKSYISQQENCDSTFEVLIKNINGKFCFPYHRQDTLMVDGIYSFKAIMDHSFWYLLYIYSDKFEIVENYNSYYILKEYMQYAEYCGLSDLQKQEDKKDILEFLILRLKNEFILSTLYYGL